MSEVSVAPEVLILLEPISPGDSGGVDPEMTPSFIGLEAEMTKMGDINYPQCVNWAQEILKNENKHLRVAGWLTLAWLRTEGLTGFKNGLLLIHELLKRYPDKMLPEKPAQRSKAIQYLNNEKRFQTTLNHIQYTAEHSELLEDIIQLLREITKQGGEMFSGSAPDLNTIINLLQERTKGEPEKSAAPPEKEKPVSSEQTVSRQDSAGEKEEGDAQEQELPEAKEDVSGKENAAEVEGGEEKSDAEPAANQQPTEEKFDIPADVLDLLDDIDASAPTGEDAENSDNQDTMVAYMSMETEMRKYSGNDYAQCLKWGREILQTKSKHLRVTIWLFIAWFRTEKITGFKKGILLLSELLKKYGKQLYPETDAHKINILQLLNTDTRFKIFEKIKPDNANAAELVEIGKIFSRFSSQCQNLFPDNPPKLNVISGIIEESGQAAQAILSRESGKSEGAASGAGTAAGEERGGTAGAAPASGATPGPSQKSYSTGAAVPTGQGQDISSEKDAMLAIKKSLLFFFEEESKDGKNRKIPDDSSIYGLSRILRWGKLKLPVNQDKVTQIEQPNEQKQIYIQKLISSEDHDALISELEVNFLNREEFPYWFDAQRFLTQALEKKGGKFLEAAQEIKFHLARLINRWPAMSRLMFRDKKTPFASPETLTWLEEEVKDVLGGGKTKEKILPPIVGEDYNPINQEYETACEELPANFEKNAKSMQTAIAGDTRPKGRFLRLLNLANYCYLAKKYSIAKVLFNQLMDQIDEYNIIEWERSLCVSVWQSTYINNQKLLDNKLSTQQKELIETQQNTLFDRIGKYDSVLALNLNNHGQNKGE